MRRWSIAILDFSTGRGRRVEAVSCDAHFAVGCAYRVGPNCPACAIVVDAEPYQRVDRRPLSFDLLKDVRKHLRTQRSNQKRNERT